MLKHNKHYFTGDYFIKRHPRSIMVGSHFGSWPKTVVLDLETMTVLAKSSFGKLSAEEILAAVNSVNN